MSRKKRYTIYDQMEEAGIFDQNPANVSAMDHVTNQSIYKRQEYPKTLYHPEGEEEVLRQGMMQQTLQYERPILVGEIRKMISVTVADEAEELHYLKLGWHDHPAKALEAAGKPRPAIVPPGIRNNLDAAEAKLQSERERREAVERELAELKAQLAAGGDDDQKPPEPTATKRGFPGK